MATPINVESWIWYGVVSLTVSSRFISRLLLLRDVRKLQTEDWFMLIIFFLFTILIVFLNICADVSTNLIPPGEESQLTPQNISDRVWGSKCVLVVESMMCAVQWGTKACLLMLYYRLTENLRQRVVVQVAAGYCLLTYLTMIALYYGYWCRPFSAFWQTPTPNPMCATQTNHLIVNLTFNLTSDLLVIFIPLPLFIRAHLELKKKLLLIFPFSLGFFTMVCAILSKDLSFTHPYSSEWLYWYTREAATAMIVANMPYSWTIIRKIFRVRAFLSRSGSISSPDATIQGRTISGVSAPTATRAHGSEAKSWPSKNFRHLSFLNRDKSVPKTNRSIDSQGPLSANAEPYSFNMADWKDRGDVDGKSDPLSSSSSEATKSVRGMRSPAITDVDRLYRLDDDDLELASATKPKSTRYTGS